MIPSAYSATRLECTCCGEPIPFDAQIVKLSVEVTSVDNGKLVLTPFRNVEGEIAYDDQYFLNDDQERPAYDEDTGEVDLVGDMCWSGIEAAMAETFEDVPSPPNATDEDMKCFFCGNSIELGEPLGWVQPCEVKLSKRRPVVNGVSYTPYVFKNTDNGYAVCIPCLRFMNDDHITMWTKGISYAGECVTCTTSRCWMHGECRCGCHK